MPKESKKFINPLLRPSQQEVEPKQEPPKQEKSTPRVQASRTQTAEQEGEQEERKRPAPPIPPVRPANDVPALPTTEHVKLPETQPVSREPARSKVAKTAARHTESETANRQENGGGEQANSHVQTYEPRPETIRARPNLTSIRPETSTYVPHSSTATMTEAVVEPEELTETNEVEGDDADDATFYEESETDFTATTTKARRKRGDQAFERTHVRFTVWVDKSLKQSFEDIAFQRDKPKTTLINEALADLVRKYEVH